MNLPIVRRVQKILLLISVSLGGFVALGQVDSTALTSIHVNRKIRKNPALLVETITAGKTTDLEKFEAIFAWVATNIKYDYRRYFSGNGSSSETDILRVLKTRRAICFQYAELMNALCAKADIHSVTVTGYAKDRLFDINDTIYFDNHAWNAVKLNDKWHLYDVTWAAGGYAYRPTKFTKRLLDWQESIAAKHTKDLKRKIVLKQAENEFCDIPKKREVKRYTVKGLPFFWRIVYRTLAIFPKRYKIDHGKVENKNYFLTDPRLFAITHFPNVPYWSLTSEISSVRDYSADSSYYDYDPAQLLMQDLEGVVCRKCDDYFALEPLDQERESIRYALENNPRNGMEPANGYFRMATYFFNEAEAETDSLQRVQLYDSTLYCLKEAKNNLNRSRKELTGYHRFHFDKEADKLAGVRAANKKHLAVNVENVKQMRIRSNKMKTMGRKINSGQRTYIRTMSTYSRFRTKTPSPKPMREETANIQLKKVAEIEEKIDSLNERLEVLKTDFTDRILTLSNDVWEQNKLLYPQVVYFYRSAGQRLYNSQDDRDKIIRELQDTIAKLELRTRTTLMRQVLLPSDTLFATYKDLATTVRLRNAEQLKALKAYGKLYVGRITSFDEVQQHRKRFIDSTKAVYCFVYEFEIPINIFQYGYQNFKNSHYDLYRAIKVDTKAETLRYKSFLKEILLNKKRIRNVSTHNLKYEAAYRGMVKAAKKKWLEKLKEEREEDD